MPSPMPLTNVTNTIREGLTQEIVMFFVYLEYLMSPSRKLHICISNIYRCNRFRSPLARLSGLQCYSMGYNGHGINLYGVIRTLMGN